MYVCSIWEVPLCRHSCLLVQPFPLDKSDNNNKNNNVPDVFASECGIYIALHYFLKDRYAYEFLPYSSKSGT